MQGVKKVLVLLVFSSCWSWLLPYPCLSPPCSSHFERCISLGAPSIPGKKCFTFHRQQTTVKARLQLCYFRLWAKKLFTKKQSRLQTALGRLMEVDQEKEWRKCLLWVFFQVDMKGCKNPIASQLISSSMYLQRQKKEDCKACLLYVRGSEGARMVSDSAAHQAGLH